VATQTLEIRVLDKTQRALSDINRRLTGLNQGLLGVNRIAGLAATALGAIGGANVIKNIVTTTARFQDLRTTLASVTGGARQGAEAFDFVTQFATKTQFGVEELTQTFIKLKASGIAPTEELLTLFTDAAAVTTDQIGSLQAITDLFSRTTAGGLGLEELNRLADRGIPVFDILQEKLGRNRLQLSDLGKTAEGANLILTALSDGIKERFGGATENRINNVSTQFSNLQIAITNAADKIGSQGFAKALGETAKKITEYIENNEELVRSIGINLTKAFLYAVEGGKLVIANIGLIGKAFLAFFGLKIAIGIGAIAAAFGSTLVKGLSLAARAVKALTLAAAANPLIAAGLVIAAGVEYLTGAFSKLAESMNLGGVADDALDALEKGWDNVADTIGVNLEGIEEFKQGIADIDEKAKALAPNFEDIDETTGNINLNTGNTNQNLTEQADKLGQITKTYKEILADATRELELSNIKLEDNKVIQELKKAELELGRALTLEEKRQIQALHEQIQLNELIQQVKDKNAQREKDITQTGIDLAQKYYGILQDFEEDFYNRSAEKAKSFARQQHKDRKISAELLAETILNIETETQNKINEIRNSALEERLANEIQREKEAGRIILASKLKDADRARLQQQGDAERAKQIATDRIEFEKKSEAEKVEFGLSKGAEFFRGLSAYNKKFFAAYKAFAIAQAIINTYQGATKALATYPPPFNFIAAAATVASGLAQVATIRAQTAQRGGNLITGGPAVVGEDGPELIVPKQPSTVIPREVATAIEGMGGRNQPVTVNFNIQANDTAGFDQLITQRRGLIVNLINTALNERGKAGITS